MKSHKEFAEANRIAWNEATLKHQAARKDALERQLAVPGASTLDATITERLRGIGLEGKRVAQLCCNNGREVISLVNLGASSGVGFDIADEAIAEAGRLRDIAGAKCDFVRCDVLSIEAEYDGAFDLVYVSIGATVWIPDLGPFFAVAARLLKMGGDLVVYEEHPFTYMLGEADDPEFDPEDPLKICFSYFRDEPWVGEGGIDYVGGTTYDAQANYGFTHKLSDVINPIVGNRLAITGFWEYSHDLSECFDQAGSKRKVPLSYALVGRKTG